LRSKQYKLYKVYFELDLIEINNIKYKNWKKVVAENNIQIFLVFLNLHNKEYTMGIFFKD